MTSFPLEVLKMIRSHVSAIAFRVLVVAVLVVGATSTTVLAGDRDGTGGYKYTIYGEETQFPPDPGKESGLGGAGSLDTNVRNASIELRALEVANLQPISLWRHLAVVRWLR